MLGFASYMTICICTLGIAYLLFRWLPRWRIRLIGSPAPLKTCSWVVIEVSSWNGRSKANIWAKTGQNQWGEFTVHRVSAEEYGHALSTVFGIPPKDGLDCYQDDDDPILDTLRILDYRYMRLLFHPIEDKFVLNNDWLDPQWTDIRALRVGLDSDERDIRDQVFGKNVLEIHQKSIPQLLMDEVGSQHSRRNSAHPPRHFTRSMYFKSPVWCFGLWTSITTTPLPYSLSPFSALRPQ